MGWNYNNRSIREGRSWTNDDGIKHPTSWGSWSEQEKTEAGLVFVAEPPPFDSRFYWDADTPKALDDVNEVDEDGEPVLDEDGEQVVTKGLKSTEKAKVKTQAGGLLAPTDWYVVRYAEGGESIPSNISAYRAAVRTASGTIEAAIGACTTHAEFIALFDVPAEGNAPIADWPEE
jgi:hypothetical protein